MKSDGSVSSAATSDDTPTISDAVHRRRWATLAVLTGSLFVIAMDMTILNIALPHMAADLHPSADQQLWIMDVYSLVLAGSLVSGAALGDRLGRKRMLLVGYVIFATASVFVVIANTASAVIAIRAVLGIGGAFIMPTTLSLIRVVFTDVRERATALSIWAAISGLGVAIGPLIGGFLLEHFSWHMAFLVNVPLMVIGIVAGIFILPESKVLVEGRWDWASALLSLVGMALFIWAIKKFGIETSFWVPRAWLAMLVAVVAMWWFTARSLRSSTPLLDLSLFESRPFAAGIIAALGAMFSLVAAMLLVGQWLQLVDGATPMQAGIRITPVAVTAACASLGAPILARRFSTRGVITAGLVVAAFGLLYLATGGEDLSLAHMLVALILVGGGTGSLAIGSAMVMVGSPEEKAGNAGALEQTAYEVGGTLGVAVLGSVAALVYKTQLAADNVLADLTPGLANQAKGSLGAAVAIAEASGLSGLQQSATDAFNNSLQIAGLCGGVVMLVVAGIVFVVTPKGTQAA